jgi:hypothetical protein
MVEVHKSCRAVHSEADAKVPATNPYALEPATACDRACNPVQ